MKRRLFNFVTILSLLLCIATCGVWVRSYRGFDALRWRRMDSSKTVSQQALASEDGLVAFSICSRRSAAEYIFEDELGFRRLHYPDSFWLVGRSGAPVCDDDADLVIVTGLWGSPANGLGQVAIIPRSQYRGHIYVAPYWLLCTLFAALPVTWSLAQSVTRLQKRKCRPAGLCLACGYDLRATPDAGSTLLDRCPECGTVPKSSPA